MNICGNNAKYLAAFLGYSLVAGGLGGFVINPALDMLVDALELTSKGTLYLLYSATNLIVGYFVFRFFVWYVFLRQQQPACRESMTRITEPAGPGDGSTRA